MDRLFIVAPNQKIVDFYLRTIERSRIGVTSMTSRFDTNSLRGLRSVPVIVLNVGHCDEELMECLKVVSNVANLKLEYIHV